MVSLSRRYFAYGLAALLVGCGGSGTANSLLPAPAAHVAATGNPTSSASIAPNTTQVLSSANTTPIAFDIVVPSSVQTKTLRAGKYVSSATKSAAISITNPTLGTQTTNVNCTDSCVATVDVPVGVDQFNVTLYDAVGAVGNILSVGSATTTISAATSNRVSIAFEGVPTHFAVNVTPAVWTIGTAATSTVTVTAYDADGNVIVGNQAYTTPITLTSTDASGSTRLSQTTINSPAQSATLTYLGLGSIAQETIKATAGSISASSSLTLATPQPVATAQPTATPRPTPTVQPTSAPISQTHIMTFQQHLASNQISRFGTNYGAVGPYINYALTDATANSALRAAGVKTGFYSTVHTICNPTTYGECNPQASQAPASVFAKTCGGNKVTFSSPSSSLVQYQTDPTHSADLTSLFNNVIATADSNGTQFDFVFDDNAYVPGDSIGWEKWYDANNGSIVSPGPYCNYTDAGYISGMQSMFNNLNLPAIANAFQVPGNVPAASLAVQYFNGNSNLWGGMLEYAYGTDLSTASRVKESGGIWQSEENTQLATSNAHRLFVAYEHIGGVDAAGLDERLYIYASLMLSFDNASLVMAEDSTNNASQVNVNPEEQLVPTQPLVAQPTNISSLVKSGGAYAREYAACYYAGRSIGPCASVVNSNASASVPFPTLSRSYGHTAVISGSGIVPSYDNGNMSFNGPAPSSTLAAREAVIVVQ
jgi:hypothetical protein